MRTKGSTDGKTGVLDFGEDSEIQTEKLPRIGAMVKRPDAVWAFITGVRVSPRGVWVALRPGGWYRWDDVEVSQ